MNFIGQCFHKLEHYRQTDTQTDATEHITSCHAQFVGGSQSSNKTLKKLTNFDFNENVVWPKPTQVTPKLPNGLISKVTWLKWPRIALNCA